MTRPDLFRNYLTEQIELLIENHGIPVEVDESNEPIPIHFAYRRDFATFAPVMKLAFSLARKAQMNGYGMTVHGASSHRGEDIRSGCSR